MPRKQSGFTLIEIAIVLVIIGLLLGGVLKGQELINSAKVKNIANDLNSVGAAVYTYQDRYKSLPGDDDAATARWSGAPNGNRNGQIDDAERRTFWRHLRLAGLIAGDAAKDDPPFNAMNGVTAVVTSTGGAAGFTGGVIVCTSNLPGKVAEAVDSQFDDGKPTSGTVRSLQDGGALSSALTSSGTLALTASTTTAAYSDDGVTTYGLCRQI